jgi:CubicO group peptidase (beta-lactamase class C family)
LAACQAGAPDATVVKELGGVAKPDGDTLFMVASNTKALTTLLLAKLVDEHRLTWNTPVTTLFPKFRLCDAETTRSVEVKHLICACTGMPRQDLEWLFEFGKITPENSLTLLGTMQANSKFGELFQYSNLMAAAAGYTAAHVLPARFGAGLPQTPKNDWHRAVGLPKVRLPDLLRSV